MNSWPNFIIVGAAKSGTTALYYLLDEHPEIKMSRIKETNYFSLSGKDFYFNGPGDMEEIGSFSIVDKNKYCKLFELDKGENISGEASPLYLFDKETPYKIKNTLPNVKIIIILRNPIDRAYSAWCHARRSLRETENFWEGIRQENRRLKAGWEFFWAYINAGMYYEQVKRYYELFDLDKIKLIIYEEFVKNKKLIISEVYNFLNVDPNFVPDVNKKYNVGGLAKNVPIQKFTRIRILKNFYRYKIPDWMKYKIRKYYYKINIKRPKKLNFIDRKKLFKFFESDINKLEKLINKNLDFWK